MEILTYLLAALGAWRLGELAIARIERLRKRFAPKWNRDPEFDCREYERGQKSVSALCETDGHHLCAECRWNTHRPEGP